VKSLAHVATSRTRRTAAVALAILTTMGAPVLFSSSPSGAGIVPTVPLATSAEYSVLGGSAVTNTGNSVLNESLGVSPSAAISGFPPGLVNAPGTTHQNDAAAALAQADLTTAYNNAAGRPTEAILAADLGNQVLQPGVYSTSSRGALQLTGPLVLDGGGNADAVFIFQTNSSLTTASSSTVEVVNGASECNVFWQIGSSATLGTGSSFQGTIMALTSVTLTTGAIIEGSAMARNGAVTLDTNTITRPVCAQTPTTTTTTSTTSTTTTTTTTPGDTTTSSTAPVDTTSTSAPPTGGVDTGGGSTAGVENVGLLVAGAALLVGALGALAFGGRVARRRSSL
jgi:hypothetical protein